MGNIFHDINEEILSSLGREVGVGGRSFLYYKCLIKLKKRQIIKI